MDEMGATAARLSNPPGVFTVSLDFELYWGMRDKIDLGSYTKNLLGARNVIPRLLDLFAQKNVHVTWATVGFLFFDEKDELLAQVPALTPSYAHPKLSPYDHVFRIGPNERKDPFHYGRSLIRRILQYPGQEIATHTFSHYYCLAEGQTLEQFRADLGAAHVAARQVGIELRSLVFPRNQWRPDYLRVCAETGIRVVRGLPQTWMYRSGRGANSPVRRAFRLADSYVNISGHHSHRPVRCDAGPINVPSSRFLRPFSPRLARLTPLHLQRIRAGMRHAAKNNLTYHLWWHPHNFGLHQEENLRNLKNILSHFEELADEYGMVSRSMSEFIPQADVA